MKRKDLSLLLIVGFIAAIFSLFVANLIFKSSAGSSSEVPVVPTISSSFPDVNNDPAYTLFLNKKALDPVQPVQIGNSRNGNPFNGSGQ